MKMWKITPIALLTLGCLYLLSCSKDEQESNGKFAEGVVELPALRNGENDVFISHTTTVGGEKLTTYSMEYDKSLKHARWVAFRFDSRSAKKSVDRKEGDDPFVSDPTVESDCQRVRADFGRQGYDRGHICASADRLYSREANDQTFYYTNMSPQRNGFNAGIWLKLEGQIQSWGRSCTASDTLYVVKGGTLEGDGVLEYIGGDRSKPVPRYYYAALLFKKGDAFKAIAFWMEHTTRPASQQLADYALSVDELEEKTGIDFFPALNDRLEKTVEALCQPSAWSGL